MRARPLLSMIVVAMVAAACGGGRLSPPPQGAGAVAPREALERFFRLADEREYIGMAWVFGTRSGPYVTSVTPSVAERQMYLFACVLRPQTRTVVDERPVAGSLGAAVDMTVRLQNGVNAVTIPFRVVRASGDRWFVESFDLTAISQSPLPIATDCRR